MHIYCSNSLLFSKGYLFGVASRVLSIYILLLKVTLNARVMNSICDLVAVNHPIQILRRKREMDIIHSQLMSMERIMQTDELSIRPGLKEQCLQDYFGYLGKDSYGHLTSYSKYVNFSYSDSGQRQSQSWMMKGAPVFLNFGCEFCAIPLLISLNRLVR